MANTGDTLADIAARGGLPRQTVSRMLHSDATGGMPRRRTIEGLATGLGLGVAVVREAAAQSAGPLPSVEPLDHRVTVLVDMCRRLPVSQVDVLLATARAMGKAQLDTPDERSLTA
jgi:hypothetical protein